MSFHIDSAIAKRKRQLDASEKNIDNKGDFLHNHYFEKDNYRLVLSVYERIMEYQIYKDRDFSQHLDWNHAENKPFQNLKNVTILEFSSIAFQNGYTPN